MKRLSALLAFILAPLTLTAAEKTWQDQVDEQVALLGHRNMIIIADSAYPVQVGGGVKVIGTGAGSCALLAGREPRMEGVGTRLSQAGG